MAFVVAAQAAIQVTVMCGSGVDFALPAAPWHWPYLAEHAANRYCPYWTGSLFGEGQ